MDTITITGIAGYDGDYPFDGSYFTNKELHTIKRLAGVRAGEIQAALAAGDNDLVVAFAAIALERNGKAVQEQVLWDAHVGSITIAFAAPEPEEDDPELPPAQRRDDAANESVNRTPSGATSDAGSESRENGQSRTGLQPSELSAA